MATFKDGKNPPEPDCMDNCSSKIHGTEICSLATGIETDAVVALWLKKCANYAHVRDPHGRNALHIVASTGNHDALGWLIKRAGSDIDKKDKISGYTALHRSIFFGQIHIARSLISFNADIHLKDNEGMTAFELCHADRPRQFEFHIRSDPSELFVWGTNDNYTLGKTIQQSRPIPEQLELFRKNNTRIMQVAICTYHSVFLTQSGEVYVCGSGRGGKLGLGHESSVLTPELLHLKATAKCIQIAAGVDHTLFLLENGKVVSCGSNECGLVGQKESVHEVLHPRNVEFPSKTTIKGVLAARYHSVFYTPRKIFTCGANRGQLGHSADKGPVVYEPKLVSQIALDPEGEIKFTQFACSDHATVVRASSGIVYVFHKFECYKINTRHFDVEKIQVIGGGFGEGYNAEKSGKIFKEDGNPANEPLTILMLTTTGRIVIWRENTLPNSSGVGTFSRVVFNTGRSVLDISDFCVSQSCLLFTTANGEAYRSGWKPSNLPILMPSLQQKALAQASQNDFQISAGSRRAQKGKDSATYSVSLEHLKLQRIKNVYAAGSIACDSKGQNFAIIQASPKLDLTSLPQLEESQINTNLRKFLEEASEGDCLHDLVFKVGNNLFPAHRYIVAFSCPKLYSLVVKIAKSKPDENPLVVPLENVNAKVFKYILQFMYTNTCDLITLGKQVSDFEDLMKLAIDTSKKFELKNLCKELRKVDIINDHVVHKVKESIGRPATKRFNRSVFEELSDIVLQNPDGYSVKAHRCILVARMEYFHSMLYANSWLEQGSSKPLSLQLSKVALDTLLDFVYTDEAPNMPCNDFDALSEILAMSDSFFMERLRTITEIALADILSLKNVASMLYIADRCNADQLRDTCMQFISLNLATVLENRILDPVPLDIVKALSSFYCKNHPYIHRGRSVNRAVGVPSVEGYLEELNEMSPEFVNELAQCLQDEEIRKPQTKTTKSKARIRSRASECETDNANKGSQQDLLGEASRRRNPSESIEVFEEPRTSPLRSSQSVNLSSTTSSSSQKQRQPFGKISFPNPAQTMMRLKQDEAAEESACKKVLNPSEFPTLADVDEKLESLCRKNSVLGSSISISLATNSPNSKSKPASSTITKGTKVNGGMGGSGKKKIKWKSVNIKDVGDHNTLEQTASSSLSPSFSPNGNPSRDPSNPWKIKDTKKVAFHEIVQDEVEKKENFQRAVTKPLNLMQIEDQAINELIAHYHSEDVEDGIELVTVERVCSKNYANPTWVQHQHSNINSSHWPKAE